MCTIPHAVRALLASLDDAGIPAPYRAEAQALLCQYPEPEPAPVITADTPVDYSNAAIREHAAHLVRNEVYACVSAMVDTVSKAVFKGSIDGVDEDDACNITRRDDWETPVRDHLAGLDTDELDDVAGYFDHPQDGETPLEALISHLERANGWHECADYCRLDPESIDVYEHWIVSGWLASQLESEGEIVARDFLGLTIWGRTTTGQSMAMDHVILKIARDALIR